MFRIALRDVLWLIAVAVLCAAWWWDHSGLTNSLKNARFAIEHQRELIHSLTSQAAGG